MADPILEALAQAQNQAIANNPYAQFGSVLSQAKNPYARADDPWGALAANAAQSLLAGMATGYGQGQVRQELNQIAPQLPALYADPMSVDVGDNDILGGLQRAAVAKQQAEMQGLNLLGAEERVKFGANPLQVVQAMREQSKLNAELQALYPNQVPAQTQPQGQALSVPEQVLKAPVTIPTQQPQNQPEVPASTTQEIAVPNQQAEFRRLLSTGMPYEQAIEAAQKNVSDALKFNRDLKMEGVKQQGDLLKQQQAAKLEVEKAAKEAELKQTEAFNALDASISKMEGVVPNLPDYGNPITGGASRFSDEMLARLPLGKFSEKASKNLAATSELDANLPKFAGEIIKAALPGPLTEKELAFVTRALPSDNKTPQQNQSILQTMKLARDIGKFENAFRQAGARKGLTPNQIAQKWEQERARLGGSFFVGSSVNPEVIQATEALNNLLGGKL